MRKRKNMKCRENEEKGKMKARNNQLGQAADSKKIIVEEYH